MTEEKIVVDMSLAYQQMEENPELLAAFALLIFKSTFDDVAFEGWIARTRSRQLDVDKNPKGEWSKWYYQSAHRSNNPYVYQKGKAGGKSEHRFDPIYGQPTIPFPNYYAPGYDRSNYQADLKASNDSRPLLGYYERVREVRPAAIVVPK